jgi:prepilin-type N-terminal cleavage/methylation domain-containing protein
MRPLGERGFTLIEVLVAMALSALVFGATLTAIETFQRQGQSQSLRNEAQDSARNAIDSLARQLRNVAAPSAGAFGALERAEPYSIAFQTIDAVASPNGSANASNAMRVRYCLNDSNPSNEVLWRQIKRWTTATPSPASAPSGVACPDLVNGDWDSSQQLTGYVTNRNGGQARPLFSYGPSGATEVGAITSVEPTIYINVRPGQGGSDSQQTSAISLRNANREPIASFVAAEVNGHIKLNASESADPDGLALTYKWLEGSIVLPTSSQQYETEKFASKTVHTFTLEVTDPGGLSNSISHTVTIK